MFKEVFEEGTVSADIAQTSGKLEPVRRRERKRLCEKCGAEMNESPVGSIGRTGVADAANHVTPELRAKFKKLVKELGGKTVAKQLLAEMNTGS